MTLREHRTGCNSGFLSDKTTVSNPDKKGSTFVPYGLLSKLLNHCKPCVYGDFLLNRIQYELCVLAAILQVIAEK